MNWNILGIEETTDKKLIKQAYRERLALINPEDKPEEFKALRTAYETALELSAIEAKISDNSSDNLSEVERWTKKLENLYDDFSRRCDIEEWKKLFNDSVCDNLDTREDIENATLNTMLRRFRLTNESIRFLNDKYGWMERKEELCEKYPRQFFRFIIEKSVREDSNFSIEEIEGTNDGSLADEYLAKYFEACEVKYDEAIEKANILRSYGLRHPQVDALIARIEVANNFDGAFERLKNIADANPDNAVIQCFYASVLEDNKDYVELEQVCKRGLKKNKNNYELGLRMTSALGNQGRYEDAIETVSEMMELFGCSNRRAYELNLIRCRWYEKRVEELEHEFNENSSDATVAYDLAYAYYILGRIDESEKIANTLAEDTPDAYSYHNIMSVICEHKGDREGDEQHRKAVLVELQNMKPDGTAKTRRRIRGLSYYNVVVGAKLLNQKQNDEAMSYFDKAVELGADNGETQNVLGRVFLGMRNYDKLYECGKRLVELAPDIVAGYVYMAEALFYMGRFSEAYTVITDGIDSDNSELEALLLRIRILIKEGAIDRVEEEVTFLTHNGVTTENTPELNHFLAIIDEHKENYADARRHYEEGMKAVKTDNDYVWVPQFCYDYAVFFKNYVLDDDSDAEDDYEYLFQPIAIALEKDESFELARLFRAWLYRGHNEPAAAISDLMYLEKLPNHSIRVERELAGVYYNLSTPCYDLALRYYQKVCEYNPEVGETYFYLGMCHYFLHEFEKSEEAFLTEQKLDPQDPDGYYRYADVCLAMGKPEEALSQVEKAISLLSDQAEKEYVHRIYLCKVRVLRRLGRSEEAIALVRDLHISMGYSYEDAMKLVFEIYYNAGMYKKAARYCWQDDCNRNVKIFLAKGKRWRAKWLNSNDKSAMQQKKLDVDRAFAKYDNCVDKTEQRLHKWNKKLEDLGSSELNRYLLDCCLGGYKEKAAKLAQAVLDRLNNPDRRPSNDYIYQYFYEALAYMALGNKEKAKECIDRADGTRYCLTCTKTACIHKVYYTALYEAFFGSRDRSMNIAIEARQKWPSELLFAELIAWLEKKRKQK